MPAEDFICPVCGAEVPARAAACPECGSDEKTGWSDQTIYDGTDIEDPAEFDRREYERRESGHRTTPLWVKLLALAALVALGWLLLRP
jgi:RNA polymerase subunit RPABC4/transcription elongation factor Spt4